MDAGLAGGDRRDHAAATVRNAGTAASGATDVNFYLGTTKVGTATVGALAAGASSTVVARTSAPATRARTS